jgi:uncharacterized membrane protein/uncharacterized RDD family membrane protein YckC
MVNPTLLAGDVLSNVVSLALTPALWLLLFLWAWARPGLARASGIGRMAFWLLLPGAFLGSLANAPFFGWARNVLAINVGGALIPLLLALVLLREVLGGGRWAPVGAFVLLLAAETATQFVAVVLVRSALLLDVIVPVIAAGIVGIAWIRFARAPSSAPSVAPDRWRIVLLLGLSSFAIVTTFLTSTAVPGEGIVSAFPDFLAAPIAIGVVSPLVAYYWWDRDALRGVPIAYGTATFGPLLGADVLHQPPLYGAGSAALLSIGGAGVLDLVYLSGLLALGAAIVTYVLRSGRADRPLPAARAVCRDPESLVRTAVGRAERGEAAGALSDAVTAAARAAGEARRVWQLPSVDHPSEAWAPLPVPSYVQNDYRNLVAQLDRPSSEPRELRRSIFTSLALVGLAREIARARFAPLGRRAWAALIDLGLVTAPAVAVWVLLALLLPGGAIAILTGIPLNAAALGYVAYALLYFVVYDRLVGSTLGKRAARLSVTNRRLARPSLLQALLRESPKAIAFFAIGNLGAPAIVLLTNPSTSPVSPVGLNLDVFTALALLTVLLAVIVGAFGFGAVVIARSRERQRLGDVWAATWVIDRRINVPAWGARTALPTPAPTPSG